MAERPLLEVEESLVFGLWPRKLLVFGDRIEVVDGGPVHAASETRAYSRIERVRALKGAWFVNLLIESPDGPLLLRGLKTREAVRVREILEERIQRSY